jgi:hypothetical protein
MLFKHAYRTHLLAHQSKNTQLGAGHVARGIGEEEGHGTHEVLGLAHFALRNEGDPLLSELGVVIEDLLGTAREERLAGFY